MLIQPLPIVDLRVPAARPVAAEPRVAVMLNANARRVTPKIIHALSHVVAEDDLFVSRSELDARRIAQAVLDRGYDTVFCGGGDGTFMGFANEILRQLARPRYSGLKAPRFGILKLGTGNGLASLVNASAEKGGGILDDVLRARAGEVPSYRRLDLLDVDGRRAQFAGLGIDGKLLNDYIFVKQNFGKGFARRLMTGPSGYFASVAFKTIPHYLTQPSKADCQVVNGGKGEAYRVNPDGSVAQTYAPGEVIHDGTLMMVAASTIPYYGFKLKMFPHAGQRRGMFALRLGSVSAAAVVAHLPQLWRGEWYPEHIHDFHASEINLHFKKPMPFQISGDAAGYKEKVRFALASEQVELVDFTGAVN